MTSPSPSTSLARMIADIGREGTQKAVGLAVRQSVARGARYLTIDSGWYELLADWPLDREGPLIETDEPTCSEQQEALDVDVFGNVLICLLPAGHWSPTSPCGYDADLTAVYRTKDSMEDSGVVNAEDRVANRSIIWGSHLSYEQARAL